MAFLTQDLLIRFPTVLTITPQRHFRLDTLVSLTICDAKLDLGKNAVKNLTIEYSNTPSKKKRKIGTSHG